MNLSGTVVAPTNLVLNVAGAGLTGSNAALVIGPGDSFQWLQGTVSNLGLGILTGGNLVALRVGTKTLDASGLERTIPATSIGRARAT